LETDLPTFAASMKEECENAGTSVLFPCKELREF